MWGGGGFPFLLLFLFLLISFGSRTCSLFSLVRTTLQLLPFFEIINATTLNFQSGFSLWDLIKAKYLF